MEKTPTSATIDVNGIGYQFVIPLSTFHQLPGVNHSVKLLTHFVVREDVQQFYGFFSEDERELFRQLISVSNVGPKMAAIILSGIGIQELRQAIVDGAVPTLSAISGVGKKTAERLIVELREKIILDERHVSRDKNPDVNQTLVNDSLQALVSLGYKKQNAKDAIQKVLSMHAKGGKMKVEELVRESLKYV